MGLGLWQGVQGLRLGLDGSSPAGISEVYISNRPAILVEDFRLKGLGRLLWFGAACMGKKLLQEANAETHPRHCGIVDNQSRVQFDVGPCTLLAVFSAARRAGELLDHALHFLTLVM